MAKYRQVHVDFWQDGFVLDLTPEDKYFYIYLMTNSKTTQCGIYELPKRIIETETGYTQEVVDKLLQRFIGYGKVLYDYDTKEIMLLNWIKYNAVKSPKVISCIKKELESVKNQTYVNQFYTLCKRYGYPIYRLSIDSGEEREQEQEEEKEREEEQEQEEETLAHNFYQQNFGILNSFVGENIQHWIIDLNNELVIEAMKRALAQQKKWSYAEAILKNWANSNVKTIDDVNALDAEFKNRTSPNGSKRKEVLPEWFGKSQEYKTDDVSEEELAKLREELQSFKRD